MKVAYIAGPYRGPTMRHVRANVRRAEECALRWWKKGFAVICPHTNSQMLDGEVEDEQILAGDLAILGQCDVIVMMVGWETSAGARGEYDHARMLRMPILYDDGGVD